MSKINYDELESVMAADDRTVEAIIGASHAPNCVKLAAILAVNVVEKWSELPDDIQSQKVGETMAQYRVFRNMPDIEDIRWVKEMLGI